MRYCPVCHSLTNADVCQHCGNRSLREPEKEDMVQLVSVEKEKMEEISSLLTEKGIHYEIQIGKKKSISRKKENSQSQIGYLVPFSQMEESYEVLELAGIARNDPNAFHLEGQAPDEVEQKEQFQEMNPVSRFVWRVISVILFIALIWAVVAGTDMVVAFLRDFFSNFTFGQA